MHSILVLLSSYNGEKYITEQVTSLLRQANVDVTIVIRDDGSQDGTQNILDKFAEDYSNIIVYKDRNVGAAKSFYYLLEYAITADKKYDYYAFCDQDDVWMEDKLYTAVAILDSYPEKKLYFSSARLVDSGLNEIKGDIIHIHNSIGACIASNRCLGCTMVFDRKLLEIASDVLPYINAPCDYNYIPLHDNWLALVGYTFGVVFYDKTSHILYRQHGGNVVGATSSIRKKMRILIKDFIDGKKERSSNCKFFLRVYDKSIIPNTASLIKKAAEYDVSIINTLTLAMQSSLYHFGFLKNIGLFFLIITRRF